MANLLKNFTLEKVIGSVSPNILQGYFHDKNLLNDIENFIKLRKELKSEPYKGILIDRIIQLESDAGRIVNDFKQLYILSKKPAYLALIDNINHIPKYKHLINDLTNGTLEKDYDRLFYLLQKEPVFIHEFYLVYTLNEHTEGFWNRRHSNIPTREENITDVEIKALENEIKRSLKEQTRGKNCKVRHINFDGKDHFFVLAEDLPITIEHWKNNSSEYILLRPSFEIAFVYDKSAGELDVCCEEGGKKLRNKMQLSFAKAVLGCEIPEQQKDDESYNLQHILDQLINNRKVSFCINSSKNIKDIFIRSMKLQGRGYRKDSIVIDTALKKRVNEREEEDIYTTLADYIKLDETSRNIVDIKYLFLAWVEFKVIYFDTLQQKDRVIPFKISGKSGCNLGFDGIDKEIRECLKIAKIQVSRVDHANQNAA